MSEVPSRRRLTSKTKCYASSGAGEVAKNDTVSVETSEDSMTKQKEREGVSEAAGATRMMG